MQVLDLPKSKLALHRDEMVKYGLGDTVVARYPTEQITRIGLEKSRDLGFPILMISVFAALAFVSHQYIASPGWSWTAVIACLGVCGIFVMSIEGRRIMIETTTGTIRCAVADLFEEAEGFVISANSMLELENLEKMENEDKPLVTTET